MAKKRKATPARKRGKTERTCVACGCTDSHACVGGCTWPSKLLNICSQCWGTGGDLLAVLQRLNRTFKKSGVNKQTGLIAFASISNALDRVRDRKRAERHG